MKNSEDLQETVKGVEKADRIYDSLARVLSPGSECVAVALISNVLCVSANEVNSAGNKAGVPESLTDLQEYVSGKFINKTNESKRLLSYAHKICSQKKIKFCFKQNAGSYTTNLHQQAEEIAFKRSSQPVSYLELKQNSNIGYNAPMVAYGAMEIMQNIENLKKVKHYCRDNGDFCPKIVDAKWVYNPIPQIEGVDKEKSFYPNMHAEMKILSKIIEEAEKGNLKSVEIYIGIWGSMHKPRKSSHF